MLSANLHDIEILDLDVLQISTRYLIGPAHADGSNQVCAGLQNASLQGRSAIADSRYRPTSCNASFSKTQRIKFG
jgi:hypothetical protein